MGEILVLVCGLTARSPNSLYTSIAINSEWSKDF